VSRRRQTRGYTEIGHCGQYTGIADFISQSGLPVSMPHAYTVAVDPKTQLVHFPWIEHLRRNIREEARGREEQRILRKAGKAALDRTGHNQLI
jgi:hypothetical protein